MDRRIVCNEKRQYSCLFEDIRVKLKTQHKIMYLNSFSSSLATFGCTGNAFSYSSLSAPSATSTSARAKNAEADQLNPNLYCSIDDHDHPDSGCKQDNRRLENMYDEIQKRVSSSSLQGGRRTSKNGKDESLPSCCFLHSVFRK